MSVHAGILKDRTSTFELVASALRRRRSSPHVQTTQPFSPCCQMVQQGRYCGK